MDFITSMVDGEFVFFSLLVIILLCAIVVGIVRQIDHWAFEKALKDWGTKNPKAATIFYALENRK